MKITFVNYFAGVSGGNRVLFEVVNGLIKKGHEVEYHALQDQNWMPLRAKIQVSKNMQELETSVPESDILVATWCMTAYIVDSLKGRKGIPAYYCQHYEPIFFFSPEEKTAVAHTYDLPLSLIANSPWLADEIKQNHNRDSKVIVPGVDQKLFSATGTRTFEKEKTKVLIYASNTPFKGFYDTTLPALNYVWRRLGKDKVEFHSYGNDKLQIPYDFPIEKHGFMTDEKLCELYNLCDLYVGGSWSESSPLPPLEALACGCPVLCTEPGTEHYGPALVRVKPRAPRILGERIMDLLLKPEIRTDMSKLGLETVKPFTWESTVDSVERYFKELLGE